MKDQKTDVPDMAKGRPLLTLPIVATQILSNQTGVALMIVPVGQEPFAITLTFEIISILKKQLGEAELMLTQPKGKA